MHTGKPPFQLKLCTPQLGELTIKFSIESCNIVQESFERNFLWQRTHSHSLNIICDCKTCLCKVCIIFCEFTLLVLSLFSLLHSMQYFDKNWRIRIKSNSPTFQEQLLRQYSFNKKLQSQTLSREKPRKIFLYTKADCIMLVKFFYSFAKRIFYRITSGSEMMKSRIFCFWDKFNKKLIISYHACLLFSPFEYILDILDMLILLNLFRMTSIWNPKFSFLLKSKQKN